MLPERKKKEKEKILLFAKYTGVCTKYCDPCKIALKHFS